MHIRAYKGHDEQELLDIWHIAMPFDRISESLFRTQVLLDPNFHPLNLPVAIADGRVVGFILSVTRQVPLFLQGLEPDNAWITAFGVHPNYRQQGIGTALFQYVTNKMTEEKRKTLAIASYVPNYFVPGIDIKAYPETITFLENILGFKTLYHAISMGANLTNFEIPRGIQDKIQQSEADDGLTIRPVASADIPELMPFLVEHFGWDWYRHAQSYLLEYFGNNPHRICFLIARLKGEVVGFCQQKDERFGPFGVHPDYQGRGIGRVLLYKCLEIMSAKQVFFSYFLWTDENAARLYSLVGFERRREFAVLRKQL